MWLGGLQKGLKRNGREYFLSESFQTCMVKTEAKILRTSCPGDKEERPMKKINKERKIMAPQKKMRYLDETLSSISILQ